MREIRYLDSFTAGEKPLIDVMFYETEIDLTGFDVDVRVERDDDELSLSGGVAWLDVTKGMARVSFADGDLDVVEGSDRSRYRMELWAGDGTSRVATLLIVFDVYRQVGASVPSI